MCRSIKVLRIPIGQATEVEIQEAALQFVRKISGYRHPSQANAAAFESAVADIASTSKTLLASLKQKTLIQKTPIQKTPPQRTPERAIRE